LPQFFACLGNDLTHGLSHDLALVQDVGFDPTVPSIPILLLGCSSGRLQRIVVRHTIEQIFNIFAGHHQVAPVTYDTATLVASVGGDRMPQAARRFILSAMLSIGNIERTGTAGLGVPPVTSCGFVSSM